MIPREADGDAGGVRLFGEDRAKDDARAVVHRLLRHLRGALRIAAGVVDAQVDLRPLKVADGKARRVLEARGDGGAAASAAGGDEERHDDRLARVDGRAAADGRGFAGRKRHQPKNGRCPERNLAECVQKRDHGK